MAFSLKVAYRPRAARAPNRPFGTAPKMGGWGRHFFLVDTIFFGGLKFFGARLRPFQKVFASIWKSDQLMKNKLNSKQDVVATQESDIRYAIGRRRHDNFPTLYVT